MTSIKPNGNIVQLTEKKSKDIFDKSRFTENNNNKRYAPFSLESIRILATQIFDYGQNISFEIPIFGNFLYRSFFEIQLPNINLNDSIITSTEYIQFKNNKLSNLQVEIDYWKTQYTVINQFSNIQIEGYVSINNLLKLNNITLSFLQSRVLTLFAGKYDNIYKYKLLIDSNIISSIDILGYVIDLTQSTFNIDTLQSTITNLYNNNINYLHYYYSNMTYSINQYNNVNTGNILCKWIDYIGHYYFSYFELNINGFTIDTYSSDYLHLKQIHSIDRKQLDNYNKLIGNTDNIYLNKGSTNYIYTPIIFSYSNIDDSINALPLIGMLNSSIKINTMVNPIKNLVYLQDWTAIYNNLLIIDIKKKDHVKKDDISNIVIPPDFVYDSVELILPQYIYRYICSIVTNKTLIALYPGIDLTYILTNSSYCTDTNTMDSNNNTIYNFPLDKFINLMNNIKTDTLIPRSTAYTIAGYHNYIDYNLVLSQIPKPIVSLIVEYGYVDNFEKDIIATTKLEYIVETHREIVLDINNNSLYESLDDLNGLVKDIYLFTRPYLNLNGLSPYGKTDNTLFLTNLNTISSIVLNLSNEYNIFDYYNYSKDSYTNVLSFYNLKAPLPDGVFYKTFSLNPNNIQPSGSTNMNSLTGKNIIVNVNDDNNTTYINNFDNPSNLGTQFKLIYSNYNILQVHNGEASLLYYT